MLQPKKTKFRKAHKGRVKGVATSGTNKTDITISNADVSKIDMANRNYKVLNNCRVLILID